MIKKITHVSILVEDQEKALHFYTDTLGLEKRTDAPMGETGERWVTVGPKGQPDVELILQHFGWGPGKQTPEERRKLVGRSQGFVFETDNIQEAYKTLKGKGVRFDSKPVVYPWGTQVGFEDLYGNAHVLSEPPAEPFIG